MNAGSTGARTRTIGLKVQCPNLLDYTPKKNNKKTMEPTGLEPISHACKANIFPVKLRPIKKKNQYLNLKSLPFANKHLLPNIDYTKDNFL